MNGIMAVSLASILAIVGSVTANSLQAMELHQLEKNDTELLSRGGNGQQTYRYHHGGTGRREILS